MASRMCGLFAFLLGIDETVKEYVEVNMKSGEERKLTGGRFRIRKVYNSGFALSSFSDRPDMVRKISLAAGAPVFLYWFRLMACKGRFAEKLGTTLMAAGAAGNLYDRVMRGRVVDYIGIKCRSSFLSKLTANLADLYLAAGSILVAVRRMF